MNTNKAKLYLGNCIDVMRDMPDNSVDAIVTDPPYELGFMGKKWDSTGIAYNVFMWAECLRVLKPGGHLLAFSGSRTYHRMTVAIEDAGFEVRDQIMWVYSTGFPKSMNLDRLKGEVFCGCEQKAERDLRSVRESNVPQTVAHGEERREVLQPGMPEQGASVERREQFSASEVWERQSGMEGWCNASSSSRELRAGPLCESAGRCEDDGTPRRVCDGTPVENGAMDWSDADANGSCSSRRPRPNEQRQGKPGVMAGQSQSQTLGAWSICSGCGLPRIPSGLGTALKPAHEPICVARKPLIGTVAENVLAHGTGALNIDGCRVDANGDPQLSAKYASVQNAGKRENSVYGADNRDRAGAAPHNAGRWPANLIHDGSEEVLQAFPNAPGQQGDLKETGRPRPSSGRFGDMAPPRAHSARIETDSSAARFFYCAKASKKDRNHGCDEVMTWENADLSRLTDALNELRRVTSGGMTLLTDDTEWNTSSFGSNKTAQFLRAIKCITETVSKTTTESKTSNCSPHLSTSESIRAAIEIAKANGSSLAELAEFISQSTPAITSDEMESALHAVRVALRALSETSKHAKRGNVHSTVKPTDLMRYLCRLVTPPEGIVLDPFTGSGSTGKAAIAEGFSFIGIEQNQEYLDIARSRIAAVDADNNQKTPNQHELFA